MVRGMVRRGLLLVASSTLLVTAGWAVGPAAPAAAAPVPAAAAEPGATPSNAPITVDPSWEGAPWQPKVQTILNVTAKLALACCVFSVLLGAGSLGLSRVFGYQQGGAAGMSLVVRGGGGAIIVASAASLVSWLVS